MTATKAIVRDPMVTLYARNFTETLDFYRRLGFQEKFRYPAEGTPIHIEFRLEHFELAVVDFEKGVREHGLNIELGGNSAELVFWTDDTDALFNQLVSEGAPVLSAPSDFLNLRVAWVRDPDANPVHIVAHRAE
ncbi:MAG: VOC family protein [Thermomicrobiales bacterium]|nr:VOC family protein [Thermomicrobiales bacterium]